MKLPFLHVLSRTLFDGLSSVNMNVRRSEKLWKTHLMSIPWYTLPFFAWGRLGKKGISLVSESSAAQMSTKDAQNSNSKTQLVQTMTNSLEFNHSVMLLNGFCNTSPHIQKTAYLAFFLAFFIFFSNFFWTSSSERTANTSRTASVP